MRTYRNILISKGHGDKVTSLNRGGCIMWHDDDHDRFRIRDIPGSRAVMQMSYTDTVEYFRNKGYSTHETSFGTNWRMMTRRIGEE